jgi:F-type H+-transporting ATPase subunit c
LAFSDVSPKFLYIITKLLKQHYLIMDPKTFSDIAVAVAVGAGMLGPGLGIGLIGQGAVQAVSRNPQAEGKIRTLMILSIAFTESLAIFALVIGFIIKFT